MDFGWCDDETKIHSHLFQSRSTNCMLLSKRKKNVSSFELGHLKMPSTNGKRTKEATVLAHETTKITLIHMCNDIKGAII